MAYYKHSNSNDKQKFTTFELRYCNPCTIKIVSNSEFMYISNTE